MPRHHVLFTERGPTVFKNVRKTSHGLPLVLIDEEASIDLVCDLTAYLGTGETISSITTTSDNVTCTATLATPIITLAISEPQGPGDITLKATLSTGDIWAGTIKTGRLEYPSEPSRYR